MTKVTYTTRALVEDESEDGKQNAREVIAGAQEQMDTTSSFVEAKMKTAAEPHVKRELESPASKARPGRHAAPERHCYSLRPEEASGGLAASSRVDREGRDRGCHRGVV